MRGEQIVKETYIATPSKTTEILEKYGFTFKKSLGQNFIIDLNILEQMIKASQIDHKSCVIEIGPGIGSLTEQLARHANKVVAIEIDKRLKEVLHDTLSHYQNIKIIYQDVLKTDLHELIKQHFINKKSIHVIANLPYYVTTPILFKLLEDKLPIQSIMIMLQKEVAERIVAKPGTKKYNALSIVVQYYTSGRILMDVPKTVFMPQPKVTSSVLHLKLRERPIVHVYDEAFFFQIVKAS